MWCPCFDFHYVNLSNYAASLRPAVGGKMHSAALWLGLSGLVIIAVLMQRKIKARIH